MNRKRMEDLLIAYNVPKVKKSKLKYEKTKKLPALSHNSSSIKHNPVSNFTLFPKESIKESYSQNYLKSNKVKSISGDFDGYEKLVFLSQQNHVMRNKSISIQQKLIEISSNQKLPLIKDIPVFPLGIKGSFHIDSVLERYQCRLKDKLKTLEE